MDFPNGISNFFSKVKFLNRVSERVKRGSVAFPSVRLFFVSKGSSFDIQRGSSFDIQRGSFFDIRRGEIFC